MIWQQIDAYPKVLRQCHQVLADVDWRLTLDIMRFTPNTASIIARRYPQPAERFAEEIAPGKGRTLAELAKAARSAEGHVKKIRPPEDRQAEIYRWFRQQLDQLGCGHVILTPCKGDPQELLQLVREKTISAMPCACFGMGCKSRNEK